MRSILQKSTPAYGIIIAACCLLVFIFCVALVARVHAVPSGSGERLITVHDGQKDRGILTRATTLRQAFSEAGITIDSRDKVEPGLDEELVASSYEVNLYRARPVVIVDGAIRHKIMTPYQTAKQIAEDAHITLRDEDITTTSVNSNMVSEGAGVQLTIKRATPVTLLFYGTKTSGYTQAETVGEMLKQKNLTLGKDDTLSVSPDTPITAGMTIELWRNGKQTATEEQDVAFETEQIQDADREIGYRAVRTPGIAGKRTVTFEIEMKNGQEISRKEIQSIITKAPSKQVEIVGAKYPPVTGPAEILDRITYWSNIRGIDANRVARIAKCESGLNPRADSGYYKGLFQHDPNYWAGRAAKYGQAGASIFDAEAQIVVSTAMMAGGGWSHWGCK